MCYISLLNVTFLMALSISSSSVLFQEDGECFIAMVMLCFDHAASSPIAYTAAARQKQLRPFLLSWAIAGAEQHIGHLHAIDRKTNGDGCLCTVLQEAQTGQNIPGIRQ